MNSHYRYHDLRSCQMIGFLAFAFRARFHRRSRPNITLLFDTLQIGELRIFYLIPFCKSHELFLFHQY